MTEDLPFTYASLLPTCCLHAAYMLPTCCLHAAYMLLTWLQYDEHDSKWVKPALLELLHEEIAAHPTYWYRIFPRLEVSTSTQNGHPRAYVPISVGN